MLQNILYMSKIVMKFGGSSVADTDRILNVANIIKQKIDQKCKVAVVVSAMAGVTNDLIEKSKKFLMIFPLKSMMLCYLLESKLPLPC